jgi:hypothetical protein
MRLVAALAGGLATVGLIAAYVTRPTSFVDRTVAAQAP